MGDEMINIVIWHGGRMDFSGSVPKYKGGEENVVGFDTDYLSYRILIACAKEDLGYQSVHQIIVVGGCMAVGIGLIQALEQFLPHTEHGKCARHVWAKWKLKHGTSASKDAFWKAVYSSNEVEYDKHAN
ncbi:hypothetical protein LINPERHAP1_LOCUS28801, partial [Linum perenne]